MTPDLIRKYACPVPRYTSYPTAPHFSDSVGPATYANWLKALDPNEALSLYLHIPFCETLCWYCGCHTKATKKYHPVAAYMNGLLSEISSVSRHTAPTQHVRHIHWGGGSPNILQPTDILRLSDAIRAHFTVAESAEFAVEIDPRTHEAERTQAFHRAGVNRVSFGIQDFDVDVQAAINRVQSYDLTRRAVDDFREAGVPSVNVDLVYGLPLQTRDSTTRTLEKVITLAPDRIALFGYAHLPQRIVHQRLIKDVDLPDAVERFAQSNRMANRLLEAGYVRIGLDHFAKPTDPLAQGSAQRNFQGYTTDATGALIGLGASAIGKLPQGYVQNCVPTGDYLRHVDDEGLATVRGHAFTSDDRIRSYVIDRLMCDLSFEGEALRTRFGSDAEPLVELADMVVDSDCDGLVEPTGDGFRVTPRGRTFIRSIAACFDDYLDAKPTSYSQGV